MRYGQTLLWSQWVHQLEGVWNSNCADDRKANLYSRYAQWISRIWFHVFNRGCSRLCFIVSQLFHKAVRILKAENVQMDVFPLSFFYWGASRRASLGLNLFRSAESLEQFSRMATANEHHSERDTIESLHRDNIFNFFRSHTAYDVLPESGKVLLLDATMSAFGAFHVMAANEQTAVPVWDGRSDRYMGMLTVSDLLEMLLFCTTSENNFKDSLRSIDLAYWLSNSERPSGCPEVCWLLMWYEGCLTITTEQRWGKTGRWLAVCPAHSS